MADVAASPQTRPELVAALLKASTGGAFAEADRIAEELCSRFGTEESTGFVYGAERLLNSGKPGEALNRLLPIQERFPADPRIPYLIALAYAGQYRHGNAEKYLRKVVEIKPDFVQGRFLLGRNLFKAGRNEEAVPHLQFAAEATPKDAAMALLLARALGSLDRYAEAATWMERAHALDPANAEVKQEHSDLQEAVRGPHRKPAFARWPEAAREFDDLQNVVGKFVVSGYDTQGFQLEPEMHVVTQGSCFAGNLANSFRRYPLKVEQIPFGEQHNNTYANLAVMRWLADGVVDEATEIAAHNLGAVGRDRIRGILSAADLYVYTLGVAPAFFSRDSGEFRMPRATDASKAALIRTSQMRTTTVSENVANLRQIIEFVRSFSPKCTIVLSLSPVPLRATAEMPSAVIADCLSKSTLRIAAHEITTAGIPRVLYWPSFEIVRWLGANHGRTFGNDDGSSHHVDFKVIDLVIDNFIKAFAGPGLEPKASEAKD